MEKSLGVCLAIFCAVFSVKSQDSKVVLDKYGVEIHGKTETVPFEGNNYTYHTYLGIPFAEPPVSELRWQKPEPVRYMYMDSPFYATEPKMPCVQFNFAQTFPQSEDCLYLNIYRPERPSDSGAGHAVAIWVHGGGFTEGFANQYDGTFMSLYGNVIVVTINYRLGLYGFLSTGDDNAPGNYALWDQHMAFQWVHDNIESFGGDKERVTIFGESAGAISVSYQGLFTQNNGLFQRIISQSGSGFGPGLSLAKNPLENVQNLGLALECYDTKTSYLMECLRSKSTDEIKNAMIRNRISPLDIGYVVDHDLVKHEFMSIPYIMDKQQIEEVEFYRSLDVMNGFNSHEGVFFLDYLQASNDDFLISRGEMKASVESLVGMFTGPLDESVLEMIMGEYTNWTNPDSYEEVRLQLVKLAGDFMFGASAVESALIHAKSQSPAANYMYHFTANPPFGALETPEWVPGANHADELMFVFGVDEYMIGRDPATTWEMQLSRKMVTYWSNFMKSGSPNYPEQVNPTWPEYEAEAQSYMQLEENTTDKSVGHFLNAREHNFWFNVFPHINMAVSKMSPDKDDCYQTSSARIVVSSMFMSLITSILVFSFIIETK